MKSRNRPRRIRPDAVQHQPVPFKTLRVTIAVPSSPKEKVDMLIVDITSIWNKVSPTKIVTNTAFENYSYYFYSNFLSTVYTTDVVHYKQYPNDDHLPGAV